MNRTAGGPTFLELISTLAVVSILVSFAMPRFLMVRKQSFTPGARSLLQEAKTLEWAYYQEHNLFDTTPGMARLALAMPAGSHWNAPQVPAAGVASIQITMRGAVAPLAATDSVWVTLLGDGASGGGSSF